MRNRALVGVVLASFMACHDLPTGPGRTVDGLLLTVTVTPGQIQRGDTATVTVTASNPTDRTVTVPGCADPSCYLDYAVQDEAGRPVANPPRICRAICGAFHLAALETRQLTFTWNGRQYVESGTSMPVPPGRYDVFGTFLRSSASPAERSLPATIVVLP